MKSIATLIKEMKPPFLYNERFRSNYPHLKAILRLISSARNNRFQPDQQKSICVNQPLRNYAGENFTGNSPPSPHLRAFARVTLPGKGFLISVLPGGGAYTKCNDC